MSRRRNLKKALDFELIESKILLSNITSVLASVPVAARADVSSLG